MTTSLDAAVSAVGQAAETLVGWSVAILVTLLLGVWTGLTLAEAEPASPLLVLGVVVAAPFAWLVLPQMLIVFAVTAAAFYLPLKIESGWLMIVAAAANFAAWAGVVGWLRLSLSL